MLFIATLVCFGTKAVKTKNIPQNCGTWLGDTPEKAAASAISQLRQVELSYPSNHYEVLVGELTLRATPPEPAVELTPVKASDY